MGTLTTLLKFALLAIQFLNWVAGRVSTAERTILITNLVDAQNLKADIAAAAKANAIAAAVQAELDKDPGSIMTPDADKG